MSLKFPEGFVWGAAAAGHQVEGFNTESDLWFCENLERTSFKEKSGIACDSYNRWAEDLDLIVDMGLNSFRMSIEWARIQSAPGEFSDREFAHYEAVLDGCAARNLKVNLTLNHFASPHWFAAMGGWLNPDAPQLFADYCAEVVRRLGSKVHYLITFNEPNLPLLLNSMDLPPIVQEMNRVTLEGAAAKAKVALYRTSNVMLAEDYQAYGEAMEAGHIKAVEAIKAIHPDIPVGLSIAMIDDELETSGTDSSARDAKREECYGRWLRLAKSDDFMGVQNYERMHYDAKGRIDPPSDAVMNQFGNEVYPPSLANCVEYAHSITGKPIFVTEHGVNSEDDALREWIIRESLVHLHATIQKGIPVLGYTHWSFLDNFEWVFGYVPKFGLCHVNRETMERTRKPSSFVLQEIASKNQI